MRKKLTGLCEPVTRDIWIVLAENRGRFPFSLSFLFTGERNILLDAGCGLDKLTALRNVIPIDALIISHTHLDHMAGAWMFTDIPVMCSRQTPDGVSDLDSLARRFAGDGKAAEEWKEVIPLLSGLRPFKPTERFDEGDVLIDQPSLKLRALAAPGHCQDHFVFFEEGEGILFSADIDLSSFGPWYGHMESSIPDFRNSIQRLRTLPIQSIISSHRGLIKENIREEIDRFEQGFEQHKELLRPFLGSSQTKSLEDLVNDSPFYQNIFSDLLLMRKCEEWMIGHLLEEMIKAGEVIEDRVPGDEKRDSITRYRLRK